MRHQLTRFSIIGNPNDGTTTLVQYALSRAFSDATIDLFDLNHTPSIDKLSSYNIIFHVLPHQSLYEFPKGIIENGHPAPVLSEIWNFLSSRNMPPIHVITSYPAHQSRVTGFDILALVLSGVAGVWEGDARLLDADGQWHQHLQSVPTRNYQNAYLFGRPSHLLCSIYQTFTDPGWPATEDRAYDSLKTSSLSAPVYAFRVALGLAVFNQLNEARSVVVNRMNQRAFSTYLAEQSPFTGCELSGETIHKALGPLVKRWAERYPSFNRKMFTDYTEWARLDGLPAQVPLIRGIHPCFSGRILFDTLNKLRFDPRLDEVDSASAYPQEVRVEFPIGVLSQTTKRRLS